MTKTDWTAADYREASKRLAIGDILLPVSQVRSMLEFAANRIEADESVVPVAWQNVVGVLSEKQRNSDDRPLFTHPPAQPAQGEEVECPECGTICTERVIRMSDDVIREYTPVTQTAQEQPGWKLVPIEPTEAMMDAADKEWFRGCANPTMHVWDAMLAASPTPPKEK